MNKRAIMLPFIFVYKTLLYIIKAPIIIFRYLSIGVYFLTWVFLHYLLLNLFKVFKFLIKSVYYFLKCLIIGIFKILSKVDDVLIAIGDFVCRVFLTIAINIYNVLRLLYKLISLIFNYIFKTIVFICLYFYKCIHIISIPFVVFIKYVFFGTSFVTYYIYYFITIICKYFYYGIRLILILIFKKIIFSFLRYCYLGLKTIFILIIKIFVYYYRGLNVIFKAIKKPFADMKKRHQEQMAKRPKKVVVPAIKQPKPVIAQTKNPKEEVYKITPKEEVFKVKPKEEPLKVKPKKKKKIQPYKKVNKKKAKKYKNNEPSKIFFNIYKVFVILTRKIYHFITYIFLGIAFIFYAIYRFIRYALIGIVLPFRVLFHFVSGPLQKIITNNLKSSKVHQEEMAVQKFLEKKERDQLRLEQIKAREERTRQREQEKRKRSMIYATVENETFENKLKNILMQLKSLPKRISARLKEDAKYSPLVQALNKERSLPSRQMVVDYEGIDAIKSNKKILYEYVVRNPETGKITKGYFDAFSLVEVHSFLISEGYEVYSIRTSPLIQVLHSNVSVANRKIKINDLIFMMTQLSTYIKAGLPLVDSLKILSKQYQRTKYLPILKAVVYDLSMGENFSSALAKQNVAFPRLLINMIKTAEMTGELPEALDDMVKYYTETEQTRKQMISALTYPMIVLIMAVGVLTFIMLFVVPKFVGIYQTMDNASIPAFTIFIMNLSNFLQANIVYIAIGIVALIILARYLYINVKLFRYMFQWIGMHIPVIGQILIYNEVTMFTKTFASLLSHNVFITDSMDILSRVTNNEIYKVLIANTIDNLNRGDRISMAFENSWAFPVPAYEMLVTGEKTGQLPEMMKKVSDYYQDLHRNSVSRLKALIEPILIVSLTAVVGVIVMAVVIPMFNLYSSMSNY